MVYFTRRGVFWTAFFVALIGFLAVSVFVTRIVYEPAPAFATDLLSKEQQKQVREKGENRVCSTFTNEHGTFTVLTDRSGPHLTVKVYGDSGNMKTGFWVVREICTSSVKLTDSEKNQVMDMSQSSMPGVTYTGLNKVLWGQSAVLFVVVGWLFSSALYLMPSYPDRWSLRNVLWVLLPPLMLPGLLMFFTWGKAWMLTLTMAGISIGVLLLAGVVAETLGWWLRNMDERAFNEAEKKNMVQT